MKTRIYLTTAEDQETFTSGTVPPASVAQLGIGFTLFRRASLGEEEFTEDLFQPLSDHYAVASFSDEGFQRGMSILQIHYDHPDVSNPIMRRIAAFVRLLRVMAFDVDPVWARFSREFDRYPPILHAIAWCSLRVGGAFDALEFSRLAECAPLRISTTGDFSRPN